MFHDKAWKILPHHILFPYGKWIYWEYSKTWHGIFFNIFFCSHEPVHMLIHSPTSIIILMSWPKLKEYFVSKACWPISCKIYSIDWTIDVLDTHIPIGIGNDININGGIGIIVGSPGQLVSKSIVWFFWLIISPFCITWKISINVWQNCSFSSQLVGYHAFNGLHSLNICVCDTKWL